MKTKMMILAGVAVAIALPALAASGGENAMGMKHGKPSTRAEVEAMVQSHFARLDTNKDGSVTKDEVSAVHQERVAERRDAHFKAMDSNADGSISRAEFDAQHAAQQGAERRGMAHDGKRGGKGHGGRQHGKDGRGNRGHGGMGQGGMGMHMLERADANQDGKVTLAEALARPLQHFDQADANKDGTLTPEERQSARQARRGQ